MAGRKTAEDSVRVRPNETKVNTIGSLYQPMCLMVFFEIAKKKKFAATENWVLDPELWRKREV